MKIKGMKKRKKQYKNVDMNMVQTLLRWRQKKNEVLKDSDLSCNLYPKKSSEPCSSCIYFGKCHHYRWEREYIHQKSDMLSDKNIRQRRLSKRQEKEENLQIQFGERKGPVDFEYGEDEKSFSEVFS